MAALATFCRCPLDVASVGRPEPKAQGYYKMVIWYSVVLLDGREQEHPPLAPSRPEIHFAIGVQIGQQISAATFVHLVVQDPLSAAGPCRVKASGPIWLKACQAQATEVTRRFLQGRGNQRDRCKQRTC